ncbi:MAG: hypothetical protein L6V84_06345 [Oscillospiraceae bacterium]|nr:MAG: hypothetical protein L6V84_06345 [Oscillospiraceae bacterium]
MDATTVKAKIKEMLCERLGIEADVLDYDTPCSMRASGWIPSTRWRSSPLSTRSTACR